MAKRHNDRKMITQEEFLKRLSGKYQRNVDISRAKNTDYAGAEDPFKNFLLIDRLTDSRVSVEDGILVRMSDKLQRIANLLGVEGNKAAVNDEAVQDTLADLANYAMILAIYLDTKQGE